MLLVALPASCFAVCGEGDAAAIVYVATVREAEEIGGRIVPKQPGVSLEEMRRPCSRSAWKYTHTDVS